MHTKLLMMKRGNGDEGKLSCVCVCAYSVCVFLNYLTDFHILGVGQFTVKAMTYCK